nr:GNAT family N-acetyltransferase [Maricaulis parjimensis]
MSVTLRQLDHTQVRAELTDFAHLLTACVEAGASIGFMAPFSKDEAQAFWTGIANKVEAGDRLIWVAQEEETGQLLGTVQLIIGLPDNQPHRGDVAKLMVSPSARRRGVARQLMLALEEAARARGLRTLVLDTVTGSPADSLYRQLGWIEVGPVPDYALFPDGTPCSTTFFYRALV